MGLDMYLSANNYTSKYTDKEINEKIWKLYPEMKEINMGCINISIEIGYWRKANAIHNWFVENCQNNVDECQTVEVSREDLKELKKACENELKTKDKPEESGLELEPKSGFFFGSYEKDEWYYGSLEETIKIINNCLKLEDKWDFEYNSSW